MMGISLLEGWDAFVLAAPFLGFLVMVMFGLDERCATPKRRMRPHRIFCEATGAGFTDPDGQPWPRAVLRPVKAKIVADDRRAGLEGTGRIACPGAGRARVIEGYIVDSR